MRLLVLHDQCLIVLDDENIERIRKQDPVELDLASVSKARIRFVGVTYLNAEETDKLTVLVKAGHARDAFALATRGWGYKPESGDNDFGPVSLLHDEKPDA